MPKVVSTAVKVSFFYTVRPCSSNPCLKGSCTDLKTPAYRCSCSAGYQGTNCDKPSKSVPQIKPSLARLFSRSDYDTVIHYRFFLNNKFKFLSNLYPVIIHIYKLGTS